MNEFLISFASLIFHVMYQHTVGDDRTEDGLMITLLITAATPPPMKSRRKSPSWRSRGGIHEVHTVTVMGGTERAGTTLPEQNKTFLPSSLRHRRRRRRQLN